MAKIILTGSCGDNATFNLYDDGLLEILGTGAMTNYSYYSDVPWYNASFTRATIANGITTVGELAFNGCTGLTSITIPDGVTSIGNYAFYDCTGLTSVTIPDSVTSIGGGAFSGCTSLTSITIPDSVTSIGNRAFYNCTGLTSITIPNSVTSIGQYAFRGCTSLTSVTIGNSVTSIGYSAFYNCSGLTSVTLPSSIISIRYKTFKNCTSLEKITLKGQPPTLSDTEVFANTPIANGTGRINVPRRYLDDYTSDTNWIAFKAIIFGVETLAELFKKIANSIRGFSGKTDSIVAQNFPDEITNTVDGIKTACNEVIIDKGGTEAQTVQELPQAIKNLPLRYKLVYNGEDMSEDYTGNEEIQEVELVNVTTISGGFQEMPNLEKFTFADTYEEDDYSVLWECPKLKELSTGGCLSFDLSDAYSKNCPLEIINFGASMDSSSVFFDFWGLYNLQKLKALNVAEGNETMKSVDGVIYDVDIAQVLFFPPGYNKTYSIPDSVTDLNISNAFAWLFALPDFACSENNELYSVVDGVLFNKDQTELIRFPCGKNVNSYVIPDSVTSIGDYAFYGCTGLTSITIPDGVTSIGTYAFSGCTGLTSITIPDGVTSIGSFAFQNCTGLTSITIPDGVTSIGTYAFSGCTGLTSATLGTGVATINSYTFNSCTSLAKLTLNKADTYITLSATNALTNTPIVTSTTEGYVYVPSALLSSYQGATNWANYKNKIKATGSE